MARCLLALGSNLGDRQETLEAAVAAITRAPDVRLVKRSRWYATAPIGGPGDQPQFLNGAAVIETTLEAMPLLDLLQGIEARQGRNRRVRWAARTLDIDLLLHNQQVIQRPGLKLPHPRMSFRPFVLEPAVEVAGEFHHPVLGGTLRMLLAQLTTASDVVAVMAWDPAVRNSAVEQILKAAPCASQVGNFHIPDPVLWPAGFTCLVRMTDQPATEQHDAVNPAVSAATENVPWANYPKLTILLEQQAVSPPANLSPATAAADTEADDKAETPFEAIVGRQGRGPTLALQTSDPEADRVEIRAALQAIWPHLCSGGVPGVE